MALYLVGIGLSDEKDITLKGLEIIKKSDFVYLENYTSVLQCSVNDLEKEFGKKIILANRELVENTEEILKNAEEKEVVFLVIGDPMCATTHVDLMLRAKKQNIQTKVVHNASIINAVGITGLEVYKFGKTVSIPFDENANSFFDFFKKNQSIDLHTLFLLDLSPKENKFLTIKQAIERLLKLGLDQNQLCIGCAALSSEKQQIKTAKAKELKEFNFTEFPQCLIIPSKLHFMEEEALNSPIV